MNNDIAQLLTNVYEIEGLLLVVTRHGDETPSLVYKRIQKAAQELNEQCKLLPGVAAESESTPEPASTVQDTPPVSVPEPVEPPVQEVPVEEREPDEDIDFEFIYDEEEPQDSADAVPASPVDIIQPPDVPQEDEDESEPEDEYEPEPEDELESEPEDKDESETEDEGEDALGEDEDEPDAPARYRDPAKDLRKYLALNDYYRFRRELFQSDEEAMNHALDLIQEMSSFNEVEDYFLGQLEWHKDSEDVQYFLDIVRKRFNQ